MDLKANTEVAISLEAKTVVENVSGGVVTGAAVDRANRETVVLEATLGSMNAGVTGGTVTMTPMEGDKADGSDLAQVASDTVAYTFSASNKKAVLRYNYIGTKRYVAVKITDALSGASAGSNTVIAAGNVLLGSARYAGKQPGVAPLKN
jgi:hypothetical protein